MSGAASGASAVTYRGYRDDDLPHIARIVAEVWYPDAGSDEERVAFGTIDFAFYCERATFARVAELDGAACGVVLAKAGEAEPAHARRWRGIGDRAKERVHAAWPDAAAERDAYVQAEHRIDNELLARSGCDPGFELVLFAVGGGARGHGVGGRLLNAAEGYLRGKGAPSYFLYTDTSCTWEFYEHRELSRVAELVAPEDERARLLEAYYLYEGRL